VKEIDDFVTKWIKEGEPPFRHSDVFRTAYAPAYRVMKEKLCINLEVKYGRT